MPASPSLRIRKEPLEVELALAGRPTRRVRVFLADQASSPFNRQRVLDLLEQTESFVPACDLETGRWESFNCRAVAWIGIPLGSLADGDGSADELYEHRRSIEVVFAGADPLEGELLYSAPEGFARVVDVLNRRERFFRLWSGDRVFLVNKESVLRVVEATVSGEPWRR